MKEPWIARFWCFVCRYFGHRFDETLTWHFNGQHRICTRCDRIISDKD